MILDPTTKFQLASTTHRMRVEAATRHVFADRDHARDHRRLRRS
jgi:hypothetical protein